MNIEMTHRYDDGTIVLEIGSDGAGLSDKQKARFVRAGMAVELTKTGKPKKRQPKPRKTAAVEGHRPLAAKS